MNSDAPMPTEYETARPTQRANPSDEDLAREPEMAHSDDGHGDTVEEPRMAEVRPGDVREDRSQEDPTHAEGMSQSELTGYRDRFADLQAHFIDDPKGATDQAGSLLKEAVDRLMESMSKGGDTERMRLGMQRYRHALETIVDQAPV
jgi:creatinine amidohydrolase/Fe(II)-dependent formamide hydrolase-like protein